MRENAVIQSIRTYVKARGGKVIKISQNGFSEMGLPDLIVITPNEGVLFVEVKAPCNKPAPIQLAKIKEIQDAGGRACWCDSFKDFLDKKDRC